MKFGLFGVGHFWSTNLLILDLGNGLGTGCRLAGQRDSTFCRDLFRVVIRGGFLPIQCIKPGSEDGGKTRLGQFGDILSMGTRTKP